MSAIGVLFDIDELDSGLYGYAAYKIFFAAVDTSKLAGCILSDGDTNATLRGGANQYCIAVQGPTNAIAAVKESLAKSDAKGLLPASQRFMGEPQINSEPLVQATFIGPSGDLINCTTGWVLEAWKKAKSPEAV
jgi:hypothetical protein